MPTTTLKFETAERIGTETPEFYQYAQITDDQILEALFGGIVTIQGPKFLHAVWFNGYEFVADCALGTLTANEENLRLYRFI
jgi:hypothetical protein